MRTHAITLCVHCRISSAGFWVSARGHETTRRPWCLGCIETLDRGKVTIVRFTP